MLIIVVVIITYKCISIITLHTIEIKLYVLFYHLLFFKHNSFQILFHVNNYCCPLVAKSCPTLCDPRDCSMPGFPVLHYLPEFTQLMSIELVMPSNHLILCCPLPLLPSILPCFLGHNVIAYLIDYTCWRRLPRVPWTARRSNQSILCEINPEYSLKGLMLKLKLQYFGHVNS